MEITKQPYREPTHFANTFARWWKFNLVGAIGFALQMAALALFNHYSRGHYLLASAAATEITLLHNFIWHRHYTWKDCRHNSTRLQQLVRFHLSNGLLSIVGCIALVWLFVHFAHLPVMAANVAAVLLCAVGNFFLGNKWVFQNDTKPPQNRAKSYKNRQKVTLNARICSGNQP